VEGRRKYKGKWCCDMYLHCFGLCGWNCAKVGDDVGKCTHFPFQKVKGKDGENE